jgi:hypothetical protein
MGAGAIYFDQFCDGKVEAKNGSKVDMDAWFIGAGSSFGKWKIGFEYGEGEFGAATKTDVSLLSLKGGYRVVDLRATKVDVILVTVDMDVKNRFELEGMPLVGIDFTQFFSEKFFVTATYQYSVRESFTYDAYGEMSGDIKIIVPRIKFTYLVTDHVGITAGYSSLSYELNTTPSVFNQDTTLGGYTLGVMYKF